MNPILEVHDVTFGYGKTPVLRDVNLHLHPGQFAALVGPSGAGKTSLLRLALGTLQPSSGEVCVSGQATSGHAAPQIAYVPQVETIDWNFPVTVEQVVLMGRVRESRLWPWPSRADKAAVTEVLDNLQIGDLRTQHIRNLSGGQQQRVFLARALIAQPDLLVLDEPTSGVDMQTAEKMLHLLLDLNRQGMTILMTTHDLNMAAAHIPWIICLNKRVIAQGTPEDVFTSEILTETYRGDMQVIHYDGLLLVHQKPHHHKLADVVVDPILGHPAPDAEPDTGPDTESVEEEVAMIELLIEPFQFEFFRNGTMAAVLAGALCGLIGVYIVLRGMSYIGHGLSHAIFGGAVVAYVMQWNFYIGAGMWGFLAALLINQTVRRTQINADAAIGVITTASFAVGVALISRYRSFTRSFDAALFGNILGVTRADVMVIAVVALMVALTIFVAYRQLLFTTFDAEVAQVYGVRTGWIDTLFALLLAATLIAALQILGVTLIAAALVIPAITARLLTDSFNRIILMSTTIGALTGFIGMYLSYYIDVASGATIVLSQATLFLLVLAVTSLQKRAQQRMLHTHIG